MSIKLLQASVNPVDPSQAPDVYTDMLTNVSTSLVPLTQRAITTRAGQITLVPHADAFAWSSSTRRGNANCIDGTPVEDSQSDVAELSSWEYVSGWAWSRPIENTAIAHYLSYAASFANWSGRLINLYA
jgi:hypothetical protein